MNSVFALEQDKEALEKLLASAPVLPNVVSKMMMLDKESDDYYEDVLSLASEDPFIAAKIIHLANSAANAGRSKIETLTQAVVRVGISQVSSLITSISLTKSFKPTQQSHRNLWLRSLQVALTATKIAQLNQANTEQAYLSGLMHQIGRFILMSSDVEKFDTIPEELITTSPELITKEMELFGFNSVDLTINILKDWQMPDIIANAIAGHLIGTISDHMDQAELFLALPEMETPCADAVKLETILSAANVLSDVIQENPNLEELDEPEIEGLIQNALIHLGNHSLFLPPAALAKALPPITKDSKELAVSLGVG